MKIHYANLRSGGSGLQNHWITTITEHSVSMDDPRYRLSYTHYSTKYLQKISAISANILLHYPKLFALDDIFPISLALPVNWSI